MSDRPYIAPNLNVPIINAVSMGSNITGPATNINRLPGLSYDMSWTGSPVGTFSFEVSNTYSQSPTGTILNAGNWYILPSSLFSGTYPVASGSAGTAGVDIPMTDFAWIRLVYNYTSGSGSLTVVPAAKVY